MLIIGLDYQRSFTFVHYVEEHEQVPYRYMKHYTTEYIDYEGKSSIKKFSFYARHSGIYNDVNPIGKILEKKGISEERVINNVGFILLDLHQAFDEIQKDIRYNKGRNLHCRFLKKAMKKVVRVSVQKGKKYLKRITGGRRQSAF